MIGGKFMSWLRSVYQGDIRHDAPVVNDPRIAMLDKNMRDNYARLEMLGINRQVLEERIESELQASRQERNEGYRARMD